MKIIFNFMMTLKYRQKNMIGNNNLLKIKFNKNKKIEN